MVGVCVWSRGNLCRSGCNGEDRVGGGVSSMSEMDAQEVIVEGQPLKRGSALIGSEVVNRIIKNK